MANGDNMSSTSNTVEDQSGQLMERIFSATQPGAVFGTPVAANGYTVITASEIMAGGGYGFGRGSGPASAGGQQAGGSGGQNAQQLGGMGSGGGGGGGSSGRPVAAIVIGPSGVQVQPIVDITKLGLAGITTWIAILTTLRKIFK